MAQAHKGVRKPPIGYSQPKRRQPDDPVRQLTRTGRVLREDGTRLGPNSRDRVHCACAAAHTPDILQIDSASERIGSRLGRGTFDKPFNSVRNVRSPELLLIVAHSHGIGHPKRVGLVIFCRLCVLAATLACLEPRQPMQADLSRYQTLVAVMVAMWAAHRAW